MTTGSKFKQKVSALNEIFLNAPEKEVETLAKGSKIVRLKKKRLLLRAPNGEVVGSIKIQEGGKVMLHLGQKAAFEQAADKSIVISFEQKKKEKKKKSVDKEAAGG